MLKKIISVLLAVLLSAPISANAAVIRYGIENAGGITETQNGYFFEGAETVLVENKEAFQSFDYQTLYTGSYLLLPLKVYVGKANEPVAVTDKMIKSDNVTFSYKVMRGAKYVEPVTLVDGKKLKLAGVAAGNYVMIPFTNKYPLTGRTTVSIQFVLSVNGITYEYTQTTLNCRIKSYSTNVRRNSVYGAKSPTVFLVDNRYSGEATFDFGDDIKYTGTVRNGSRYFFNLSREANTDITAMYPGAYLAFYSFLSVRNTFPSLGRLEIPVDIASLSKKGVAPSLYVYRLDGSNLVALTPGVISFNSASGKLTIYTATLDNYVLSNQPLERVVTTSDSSIIKSGYASSEEASN